VKGLSLEAENAELMTCMFPMSEDGFGTSRGFVYTLNVQYQEGRKFSRGCRMSQSLLGHWDSGPPFPNFCWCLDRVSQIICLKGIDS
jgi:hypothetical protein